MQVSVVTRCRRSVTFVALLALVGLGSATIAQASWKLTGTLVQQDGFTGVPDLSFTLVPDSTVGVSDQQGDFLVPWSGQEGYLSLMRAGDLVCRRIALRAKAPTTGDSTLDLGPIMAGPSQRFNGRGRPRLPNGVHPPDTLQVAGPGADQPDSYWFVNAVVCDIWARPVKVTHVHGDPPPAELEGAIQSWLKSAPWIVAQESSCGLPVDDSFQALVPVTYWWRDGLWIRVDNHAGTQKDVQKLRMVEQEVERSRQGLPPDTTLHRP